MTSHDEKRKRSEEILAGVAAGTHRWYHLGDADAVLIGPNGKIVGRYIAEPETPPDPDLGEPEG